MSGKTRVSKYKKREMYYDYGDDDDADDAAVKRALATAAMIKKKRNVNLKERKEGWIKRLKNQIDQIKKSDEEWKIRNKKKLDYLFEKYNKIIRPKWKKRNTTPEDWPENFTGDRLSPNELITLMNSQIEEIKKMKGRKRKTSKRRRKGKGNKANTRKKCMGKKCKTRGKKKSKKSNKNKTRRRRRN